MLLDYSTFFLEIYNFGCYLKHLNLQNLTKLVFFLQIIFRGAIVDMPLNDNTFIGKVKAQCNKQIKSTLVLKTVGLNKRGPDTQSQIGPLKNFVLDFFQPSINSVEFRRNYRQSPTCILEVNL